MESGGSHLQMVHHLGKGVGLIPRPGLYVTDHRKEHFFVKFHGFGLSTTLMKYLKSRGVEVVRIRYHRVDGSESIYEALLAYWYAFGVPWTDREYDQQLILSVTKMKRII